MIKSKKIGTLINSFVWHAGVEINRWWWSWRRKETLCTRETYKIWIEILLRCAFVLYFILFYFLLLLVRFYFIIIIIKDVSCIIIACYCDVCVFELLFTIFDIIIFFGLKCYNKRRALERCRPWNVQYSPYLTNNRLQGSN